MTTYKQIFDLALRMYDDPSLLQWPEEDLINELYGHLCIAIAKIPNIRTFVVDRDIFDLNNIESCGFHNELSDSIKMVLALGMKRAWLQPMIASTTLTLQRYSHKEGFSQKEHLKGLMDLDESIRLEIIRLLRDDSYVDSDYYK